VKLINEVTTPCPKCKGKMLSPWHLKFNHGIEKQPPLRVLERLLNDVSCGKKNLTRSKILKTKRLLLEERAFRNKKLIKSL